MPRPDRFTYGKETCYPIVRECLNPFTYSCIGVSYVAKRASRRTDLFVVYLA
jgi:hypothetical protein